MITRNFYMYRLPHEEVHILTNATIEKSASFWHYRISNSNWSPSNVVVRIIRNFLFYPSLLYLGESLNLVFTNQIKPIVSVISWNLFLLFCEGKYKFRLAGLLCLFPLLHAVFFSCQLVYFLNKKQSPRLNQHFSFLFNWLTYWTTYIILLIPLQIFSFQNSSNVSNKNLQSCEFKSNW